MEQIQFDAGIRSYRLGAGVLRFHPGDPNLYSRFLEAVEKLKAIEAELTAAAEAENADILQLMGTADQKMKQVLDWIFGKPNDFEVLLEGVNLLAVAENGERVVTNLFAALEPVLTEGARRCARDLAAAARAEQL